MSDDCEIRAVVERLRDIYTPEGVEVWLHGRNSDLGGERPINLLAVGEFDRVLAAIERLI